MANSGFDCAAVLMMFAFLVLGGMQGCADDEQAKPTKNEAGQFVEAGPSDIGPKDGGGATCAVDFPCFGRKTRCNGATKYYKVQTFPCEKYCGDAKCTGGSCDPVGPEMECPPGTVCEDKGKENPCVGIDAGPGEAGPG